MIVNNPKKQLSVQYITNEKGDRTSVIIPLAEFEELLMDIEDLKDIYERQNEDLTDNEDFIKELKADGLLSN